MRKKPSKHVISEVALSLPEVGKMLSDHNERLKRLEADVFRTGTYALASPPVKRGMGRIPKLEKQELLGDACSGVHGRRACGLCPHVSPHSPARDPTGSGERPCSAATAYPSEAAAAHASKRASDPGVSLQECRSRPNSASIGSVLIP